MKEKTHKPLAWVEISKANLKHNFSEIRKLAVDDCFKLPHRRGSDTRLTHPQHFLAVVKADAYGHGMSEAVDILAKQNIGYFGVANVLEGVALRKQGVKQPILIFENTLKEHAPLICEHKLTPTVCTHELAHTLNKEMHKRNRRLPVHIKVDTGMGRVGIWHKDAFDVISQIERFRHLVIEGLYTHFPVADTDKTFTRRQLDQLHTLIKKLDQSGIVIPLIHASNSMGLAGYKTRILNLFRPGLMLYGQYPHKRAKNRAKLKPVMRVCSKVIFIKQIERGRSISYGRTFIAKKPMTVATVAIGYRDGYMRALSNKASVLLKGKRCRVLGRVTMDQIVIDVTNVQPVKLGDTVTVLGQDGDDEIGAVELADWAGTINYEIVCSLGNNLPRVFKK